MTAVFCFGTTSGENYLYYWQDGGFWLDRIQGGLNFIIK